MSSTTADTTVSSGPVAASDRGERRVSLFTLCLMALGVGIMTGAGAVALRALIGLIHNAMINGLFKIPYDANVLEGPSRWGNWVILSPILGGLVVVYLVHRFAPEARGHGVPEVMDAIFYKRGNIRWQAAVIKSLASALVGSHLGLRISNLVPKKPSNVRISTQNILTFDGFASPLEVKPGCFPYAFERSSAP